MRHPKLPHLSSVCLLVLVALLAGCGHLLQPSVKRELVQLQPGSYTLDPRHTAVLFKVNHLGLSKFVGRFNRVEASLEFDPADIAAAQLTALVYIDSLDVNNPDFAETLTGSSWLNAAAFPQAMFVTRQAEWVEGNLVRFTGDFTLAGKTAPLVLDVIFNGGANNLVTGRYTLGFSAQGNFLRSMFGIDQFIPTVGDEIELEVHAEFLKN